jgi:hypothetical protein
MPRILYLLVPALLVLGACGAEQTTAPDPTADAHDDHSHDAGEHGGPVVVLGDHVAHVEGLHDMVEEVVDIWITDGAFQPMEPDLPPVLNLVTDEGSVRVTAKPHGDGWRFEHEAFADHPEKARLSIKIGGKTYNPDLPHGDEHGDHAHDDHDHAHAEHGPHEGTVAAFEAPSGKDAGYVELKLHDDKGDLELWIATDEAIETPFDLPLDATVEVRFANAGKTVTLKVRNAEQNEDEDGTPNNRGGKTNYFIFPGDTGADASWLMGSEFADEATVTFSKDGVQYVAGPFDLRPHTHD